MKTRLDVYSGVLHGHMMFLGFEECAEGDDGLSKGDGLGTWEDGEGRGYFEVISGASAAEDFS